MEQQRKHLYLLEVVIKKISINASILLKSFSFNPAKISMLPIVVKTKFSDIFYVEIDKIGVLQVDKSKAKKKIKEDTIKEKPGDEGSVKEKGSKHKKPEVSGKGDLSLEVSGKSCLFPLSTEQMEREVRGSPMYVECYTRTEGNMSPILLGRTKINLGSNFLQTVCTARTSTYLPASTNFETSHNLTNIFGETSGTAEMSIRLSCFGNALLSDFKSLSPMISDVINKDQYIKNVQNNCKFYLQDALA